MCECSIALYVVLKYCWQYTCMCVRNVINSLLLQQVRVCTYEHTSVPVPKSLSCSDVVRVLSINDVTQQYIDYKATQVSQYRVDQHVLHNSIAVQAYYIVFPSMHRLTASEGRKAFSDVPQQLVYCNEFTIIFTNIGLYETVKKAATSSNVVMIAIGQNYGTKFQQQG